MGKKAAMAERRSPSPPEPVMTPPSKKQEMEKRASRRSLPSRLPVQEEPREQRNNRKSAPGRPVTELRHLPRLTSNSWDYPLTREDKKQRLMFLFEDELRDVRRSNKRERRTNEALRVALAPGRAA